MPRTLKQRRRLACCSAVNLGLTVLPCTRSHLVTEQDSSGLARSKGNFVGGRRGVTMVVATDVRPSRHGETKQVHEPWCLKAALLRPLLVHQRHPKKRRGSTPQSHSETCVGIGTEANDSVHNLIWFSSDMDTQRGE